MNARKTWKLLAPVLCLTAVGCQSGPAGWWNRDATASKRQAASNPIASAQIPAPEMTEANRLDVLLAAARSLENDQSLDEAVRAYEHILTIAPDHPKACHRLAVVQDRLGRPELAAPLYQKALQRDPTNASLHCDFGYSCYLRENWSVAEHHLREAARLRPNLRRAEVNLGMLLARTGRDAEALAVFSHAGLSEAEARNNLAFAMSVGKRFDAAADQYAQAVRLDPQLEQPRQGAKQLGGAVAKMQSPQAVQQASYETTAAPAGLMSPDANRAHLRQFPDSVAP